MEDTFENVGINIPASVCKTMHGIVWINKSGLYLYNGQELKNLIDNKIPISSNHTSIAENYWQVNNPNYDKDPCIAYEEKNDSILASWSAKDKSVLAVPDAVLYNFPTQSFSFLHRTLSGNTTSANTGQLSNMITNEDGEITWYRYKSTESNLWNNMIMKYRHYSWNYSTSGQDNNAGDPKFYYFTTKDFTFGNIAVRKKIYKVYITYKCTADSGVAVKAAVDGGNTYNVEFSTSSKFKGSNTLCYGSSTLDATSAVWKTAELKFSNTSLVNNIFSFKLEFSATSVTYDFEINDISISYKTKRVR